MFGLIHRTPPLPPGVWVVLDAKDAQDGLPEACVSGRQMIASIPSGRPDVLEALREAHANELTASVQVTESCQVLEVRAFSRKREFKEDSWSVR